MAPLRRTDDTTAERLLSGRLDPADAPPELGAVISLLASAAVPAEPADPDATLLTAMSVAARSEVSTPRRMPMLLGARSAKIGAVALGGVLLMGGTAAAANSGALPDVAQDVAHDVAGAVGLDVPDSKGLSDEVHDIVESTDPGRERGERISDAAHDRNEARKAARDEAAGEGDGAADPGRSADAHEANEDRKAARGDDDSDDADADDHAPADHANPNAAEGADNAEDGADNAADPADHAADPAREHLEDAQGNRP